jgi:5'(3')-deoxyribonucleotidase
VSGKFSKTDVGHIAVGERICLGIDFGGVIIPMVDRARRGDTQISDQFLSTPPHHNAVQVVGALVRTFDGNVWIVSKAGHRTEALTRQWLHQQDFFRRTRMDETRIRFCRERPEKKLICSDLGITHFIDDRVHVMQVLRGTVDHLYLFGDKEQNRGARRWTTLVEDWTEVRRAILRDLRKHDC